jgi:hypothetical protein
LAGASASRFGDFIQSLKLIPRFGLNEGWRLVLARRQSDRQFEGGTSPMTVISLVELRPAAKGVSSPIANQAPALDALSIKRQDSKHPIDAESEPAHLPDLAGGQVWVIEISPPDELSTLHRKIVTESNVMIYDRSLEAIVAGVLPPGGYAEADSSAQAAQRCVRLARDGWSVVRLVDRQTPAHRRTAHLQDLARRWQTIAISEPTIFFSSGAGRDCRRINAARAVDAALTAAIDEDVRTVVFCAIGAAFVPTSVATPANGLAG